MGGIYIHIPYCKQVCYYCDFHFRVAMKDKADMIRMMEMEILLRKDYLRASGNNTGIIVADTLYVGGGTPSVFSIAELASLMHTIQTYYILVPGAEITIEVNPDDLTEDYLSGLRQLGFNRLSIGIQSFFDDDLKWMNRRHNSHEAVKSVETARRMGFNNINIDLIYGLPLMTLQHWTDNLTQFLALDVPHLSAYHLTIEPRTVFGRRQQRGETFSVPEDDSVRQFNTLLDITGNAGFEHYEISNFARPGFLSQHNSNYWRQKPYIGIGPSAHSYDGVSRQWNLGNNSQYIKAVGENECWFEREELSISDQYNDYILTALRTSWGADTTYISEKFGKHFLSAFQQQAVPYIRNGFLEQSGDALVLTRKGKMIADRIASDLFWDK